jgi:hypothetical protein
LSVFCGVSGTATIIAGSAVASSAGLSNLCTTVMLNLFQHPCLTVAAKLEPPSLA